MVCQTAPMADPNAPRECTARDDFFNSALAVDLKTGAVKWAQRVSSYDTWTVACNSSTTARNCPMPAGPDFDLGGSGPNLIGGLVGFGQKSGVYWGLDAVNGNVVWNRLVGPGGTLGGIEWGSASDGKRIYVAIGNNSHKPSLLAPNGPVTTGGSWAALDVASGKILWQVADPDPATTDPGSVSIANGVVYAGSYAGVMYALDAATGATLWTFDSGGSVLAGPAIVSGTVFWGSGYRKIRPGIGNNKLYAFTIP
jgi:polyvinyl alcohol dehydrogenase (cytochrome)